MRIEAVTACVGYDDFLALTLPTNRELLEELTILTAPGDEATIELARKYSARVLVTEAWRVRGVFNKGRALNQWRRQFGEIGADVWLMTLDADILLRPGHCLPVRDLEPAGLYSAERRMCLDESSWNEFCEGRPWDSFPIQREPVINGRLWGTTASTNPAGLLGYLQLWNPSHSSSPLRFLEAPTAADYDVHFGLSFPEEKRHFLPNVEVLHLGMPRRNWSGRKTPRWTQPASTTAMSVRS